MKIVLYSTNCPKCKVLEKKINEKNINYEICTDTSIMAEKGFIYLPVLEIDGECKDFSSAIKLINGGELNAD